MQITLNYLETTMGYALEKLSSRQFEVLAANYVKNIAPQYNWVLTQSIGDFNRDLEAHIEEKYKWGEAKHTAKPSTSVSKYRWDPTILSAILKNNVDEIYLITCGQIPLEYIVRAEHLKKGDIKKIKYINRLILDRWLANHNIEFSNFNEDKFDIKNILDTLYTNQEVNFENKILINFYNLIENDLLEHKTQLYNEILYELNITLFCSQTNATISIQFPSDYQILAYGFFKDNQNTELTVEFNKKNIDKKFNVLCRDISFANMETDQEIIVCEKALNDGTQNKYKEVMHCNKNDLMRLTNRINFYSYTFNSSYEANSKTLCQFATSMLLNVNFIDQDDESIKKILNSTLAFCDFWLLDLSIGCVNEIFAMSFIRDFCNNVDNLQSKLSCSKLRIPNSRIYYLEGIDNLDDGQKKLFLELKRIFLNQEDASIIINNINTTKSMPKVNIDYLWQQAIQLYNQTRFYDALYYFNRLIEETEGKRYIPLLYKYADCLNHCGSMRKSLQHFYQIIKMSPKDESEQKIIFEAQTEIFNIRFWQLDAQNLVEDIDRFLSVNHEKLTMVSKKRDLYSYYNLLNRRMVTLYYLEKYDEAESAFVKCMTEIRNDYDNYKAFAYMDSARGLYKKDIFTAQKRLEQAFILLKKLKKGGHEIRRYYDCKVEVEYVKFIIDFIQKGTTDLSNLLNAVTEIKINGYKNMLLKCYLKLATCYLATKNLKETNEYLSFIANNTDFSENIRVKWLYENINSDYLKIKQSESSQDIQIGFNCVNNGQILLESRVW